MWAEVGRIKTVWDGFYVERIRSLDGDTDMAGWYNGVSSGSPAFFIYCRRSRVAHWNTLSETLCLEYFYGILCLEHFVWNTFYGILCLEYFVWNTLYGILCLEYFVWNTLCGILCTIVAPKNTCKIRRLHRVRKITYKKGVVGCRNSGKFLKKFFENQQQRSGLLKFQ